jgi:uncharacterized membrane protein YfcA
MEWYYFLLVFLAGFIDSIAGGGGLITVPVLTLIVGPGAIAIGTNKIVGLAAALTALLVYARKGHLRVRGSMGFLVGLAIGTWVGAKLAIVMPVEYFKWFLIGIAPVILFITLKRDSFLTREPNGVPAAAGVLAFWGFACGAYDGAFGPGGGTFMFLSLTLFGGFSLLGALATSKLANTLSAGVSLASFAFDGAVVWSVGLQLMGLCVVGAFVGSQLASQRAKQVVRPVLVVVVLLLLARLATMD